MEQDTIAAISTPFGEGAIAVIRVSGPTAKQVVGSAFKGSISLETCEARRAYLGSITAQDGSVIDQVLATVFTAPGSYTGEDLVELGCHGGILVSREVYSRILEAGARPAEPGEFTQRAFINGKLDLTQAEAVMDLIRARTDLALRSAAEQLDGTLGNDMNMLRADLLGVLAHIEAYIDFPEEDIQTDTADEISARLSSAKQEVERLLDTAAHGRVLREGLRTVIAGPPNAGKSSLLNVLLGFERAIVSESAGTTRDTIEEVVDIKGVPVRLTDTAGVRDSGDAIEKEGIARTGKALENADLIIALQDGSTAPQGDESISEIAGSTNAIHVLNKADLGIHPDRPSSGEGTAENPITISCTTNDGIDLLTEAIAQRALGGVVTSVNPVAINARHQECLRRAAKDLDASLSALAASQPPEITAIEIRSALDAIGEVVGKADTEELLGEIFSSFCIGK